MNDTTAFGRELLSRPNTFDPLCHRIVTGIASTSRPDLTTGKSLRSSGASAELPIPLLLAHDWDRPLGLITKLKAVGDELWFEARFVNVGWHWAQETWTDLVLRCFGASVQAQPAAPYSGLIGHWKLIEVSLMEFGEQQNLDAAVTRVTERIDHRSRPIRLLEKSPPRFEEIVHLAGRKFPEERRPSVVRLNMTA